MSARRQLSIRWLLAIVAVIAALGFTAFHDARTEAASVNDAVGRTSTATPAIGETPGWPARLSATRTERARVRATILLATAACIGAALIAAGVASDTDARHRFAALLVGGRRSTRAPPASLH